MGKANPLNGALTLVLLAFVYGVFSDCWKAVQRALLYGAIALGLMLFIALFGWAHQVEEMMHARHATLFGNNCN